jgi:Ca2+-binding EF-hand superfamily protein
MKRELFGRAVVAVVALAAASLLPYPAPAEDPGSPMTIIPDYHKLARGAASPAELFAILDTDANGQIDRTEWQIRKMAIFYMRDRNNDLQLAPDELPGLDRTRFSEADLNADGTLSGYEFDQAGFARFEQADRNTDGAVSTQEFEAFAAAIGTGRSARVVGGVQVEDDLVRRLGVGIEEEVDEQSPDGFGARGAGSCGRSKPLFWGDALLLSRVPACLA